MVQSGEWEELQRLMGKHLELMDKFNILMVMDRLIDIKH